MLRYAILGLAVLTVSACTNSSCDLASFTLVSDDCGARSMSLDGSVMTRVPAI